MIVQPKYGSIGVELGQLAELRNVKSEWENRAGRKFRWGDFLMMLLTLQQGVAGVAEMGQEHEPATQEELDSLGVELEEWPGIPITLSEQDQERIAELITEKVVNRLGRLQ